MGYRSAIEWTDATWNPIRGCTKITPGCKNCYAEAFAERFRGVPGHPFEQGFDLRLIPEKLDEPQRWRRPLRIFVNSMSDLFHPSVPTDYIKRIGISMHHAHWHTFQVLTKRHERMNELLSGELRWIGLLKNVWWGVSVEDREHGLPRMRRSETHKRRHTVSLHRTIARRLGRSRPHWHRLGNRRGRKWHSPQAYCGGVGAQHSRSVPGREGAVLFQTMGRSNAKASGENSRRARVGSHASRRRFRGLGTVKSWTLSPAMVSARVPVESGRSKSLPTCRTMRALSLPLCAESGSVLFTLTYLQAQAAISILKEIKSSTALRSSPST